MQLGPKQLTDKIVRKAHNVAAIHGLTPARLQTYAPAFYTPADLADLQAVFAWSKDYIGKSHPELGRNGAICPFVPKALRENRFVVTLRPEVTTYDTRRVEQLLLEHVRAFKQTYPARDNKDAYNSLLLVFHKLPEQHGAVVDEVHTRQKSNLMHRGIMLSNFHPLCDKVGVKSEKFTLYKAPFPCIVVRHMGIHDIIFLSHNKAGFAEYRRRFGAQYTSGKINNDHGYVDLFNDAVARF